MRKTLLILTFAAVAALSTPAAAQRAGLTTDDAALATGVVAGGVVGAGIAEGWFGSSVFGATTAGGAAAGAAIGGVAGVGAITFIHALTTRCDGFHVFFSGLFTSPEGCVNGRWVGDQPPPRSRPRR